MCFNLCLGGRERHASPSRQGPSPPLLDPGNSSLSPPLPERAEMIESDAIAARHKRPGAGGVEQKPRQFGVAFGRRQSRGGGGGGAGSSSPRRLLPEIPLPISSPSASFLLSLGGGSPFPRFFFSFSILPRTEVKRNLRVNS